jgi:hypothetical protein
VNVAAKGGGEATAIDEQVALALLAVLATTSATMSLHIGWLLDDQPGIGDLFDALRAQDADEAESRRGGRATLWLHQRRVCLPSCRCHQVDVFLAGEARTSTLAVGAIREAIASATRYCFARCWSTLQRLADLGHGGLAGRSIGRRSPALGA